MNRRKVLGVDVETDAPAPDTTDTDGPGPAPGGFFSGEPPAGPDEIEAVAVSRIADSLDGIRAELAEIRKMMAKLSGG